MEQIFEMAQLAAEVALLMKKKMLKDNPDLEDSDALDRFLVSKVSCLSLDILYKLKEDLQKI